MKTILRLASIPQVEGENSKKSIVRFISQCFDASCSDSNAHVIEDAMKSDELFIFGSRDPDAVCDEANGWNVDIRSTAKCLMSKLLDHDVIPMDTLETYCVRKAIAELDNAWSEDSEHLVLLPDSTDEISCETIIPDCYLEDIQRAPEDYVIVLVSVKKS